jgi:hypothetical protein
MNRCDLPCAMLATLLLLVSIPGATWAGSRWKTLGKRLGKAITQRQFRFIAPLRKKGMSASEQTYFLLLFHE